MTGKGNERNLNEKERKEKPKNEKERDGKEEKRKGEETEKKIPRSNGKNRQAIMVKTEQGMMAKRRGRG